MLKVKLSLGHLNQNNNNKEKKPLTLIVDASGLTITKKGDYIEQKWIRMKRQFIKLHIIAVDAKSKKVVSFIVAKGIIHDSKKFSPMIREASEQYDIGKVYADKAHDNRGSFNLLDNLNIIEVAINIRKNASIKTKGYPLRRDEVLLIKKLGYERWKQFKDAAKRWTAEIVFSSIKRVFGENLLSKKFKAQKIEAGLKVMLYNKFIGL
ncbi:MAG: transposase [Nitrososphaeraceae archaeon]|nr:transposase [Nitrososphaeraceae archaeon]